MSFPFQLKFRKRAIPWKLCIAIAAPLLLAAIAAILIVSGDQGDSPDVQGTTESSATSIGTVGTLPPITLDLIGPDQSSSDHATGTSADASNAPGTTTSSSEPPQIDATAFQLLRSENLSGEESDNGQVVLRYQVSYPVFSASDESGTSPDVLNEAVAAIAAEYEKYALEELLTYAKQARTAGDSALPYRLTVEYEVTVCSATAVSVVFTETKHTGESHDSIAQQTYNFSVASNAAFKLSGIFSSGLSGNQETIYDAILTEIRSNPSVYYADYENLVYFFDLEDRWYFSEKGLVIYFNPFELASYGAGILQFTIPYSDLTGQLKINPLYMG